MRKNKSTKYLKLVTSIIIAVVCILGYSSFFGNPIGYINAKNKINAYIDEKYNGELKIDKLSFNSKMNGYYATVSHINDARNSSYIGYCRTGYLNDGYKFDVRINMEEEVKSIIESLIIQGTDLVRENIGISPSIEIEEFKYKLDDNYTGMEPINLEIWLHPYTSYKEKDNNKNTKEKVVLYKNEEEFAKDTYNIIKILQSTNYNFSNIEIYSYKEDGNTSYRFKCKGSDKIGSKENIINRIFIKESEKEKELK